MEHFLINSSVCLFVLWLFYKLSLENTSCHHWKRLYLIGTLIISSIIPFIVIETIVIPIQDASLTKITDLSAGKAAIEAQNFEINGLYVLMLVYFIGVAVMLWRFGKNIYSFTIKPDDEVSRYKIYPLILRQEITVPHSFFNRIFVNAKTYKKDLIPKAVLEHEKAHLDQKHSIDILFIELLLVFFWFNPIFYIIRYSMKLNHEFLADRTVIQQGVNTMTYQELILQHATNSYQHSMANTFNFPIIKKRFNIMKTNTSKVNRLLRSLAVIPILTLLILGCGQEETKFEIENQQNLPTQKEVQTYNAWAKKIHSKTTTLSDKAKLLPPVDEQNLIKFSELYKRMTQTQKNQSIEFPFPGLVVKDSEHSFMSETLTEQHAATKNQIAEYNAWARTINSAMEKAEATNNKSLYPIVKQKDYDKYNNIYSNVMTETQRKNSEPWPTFPPPPAPHTPPSPK